MTVDEPPDPLRARGLALVGYGLVVAGFFTIWLTGLAAWVLALVNRKSPDPLARSHFRNQLRITDLYGLMAVGGMALVVWGGWTVIAPWFEDGHFSWSRLLGAGAWVLLGLAIWAIGTLTAIASAVIGAVRLLRGEPARRGSAPTAAASLVRG